MIALENALLDVMPAGSDADAACVRYVGDRARRCSQSKRTMNAPCSGPRTRDLRREMTRPQTARSRRPGPAPAACYSGVTVP